MPGSLSDSLSHLLERKLRVKMYNTPLYSDVGSPLLRLPFVVVGKGGLDPLPPCDRGKEKGGEADRPFVVVGKGGGARAQEPETTRLRAPQRPLSPSARIGPPHSSRQAYLSLLPPLRPPKTSRNP